MKKKVQAFIKNLGGTSSYSGNTRTLFINDPRHNEFVESIESAVLNKFGFGLSFTLKTN